MSDYLTYELWRQREKRMPRELERQRVALERLDEQRREQPVRDVDLDATADAEPTDAEPKDAEPKDAEPKHAAEASALAASAGDRDEVDLEFVTR